MRRSTWSWAAWATLVAPLGLLGAEEKGSAPRAVPLTRPELKQLMEDLKDRKPRIPRPELSEEERAKLRAAGGRGAGGGIFWVGREADPNISLDPTFKTEMFWIVSRANNCHY